jgi:CDP-diacylglycerol--serine O-phosphatidyltransferase
VEIAAMSHVFPPFEPEKPADGRKDRRPRVFRPGHVPVRVLIPSMFTLMALCAGLTAIRMGIEHRFELAIAAVVLAAFLDGIDGRVARLLKATSRFGAELDSLADFVNFGVAPGIIIFTWALADHPTVGWIIVLIYAICAALRLARFNVALDAKDQPAWKGNYFVGVPAPAGALLVLLPLYVENLEFVRTAWLWPVILAYTLAVSLLMVSRVPTFSGKAIGQRVAREHVLPVFLLAAIFVAMLLSYPYVVLTAGSAAYLAVIPVSFLRYRRVERRMKEKPGGQNVSHLRSTTGGGDRPPAA